MIKKLAVLFLGTTLFLSSCTETPFVPNVDNELLVGSWNIDNVDNADALVSGTEMMTSILNEKFLPNNTLVFDKGANFHLLGADNKTVFNGQYSIGAENKVASLKIDGVAYEYDLINLHQVEEGIASYSLNSATPGETVKLTISKK